VHLFYLKPAVYCQHVYVQSRKVLSFPLMVKQTSAVREKTSTFSSPALELWERCVLELEIHLCILCHPRIILVLLFSSFQLLFYRSTCEVTCFCAFFVFDRHCINVQKAFMSQYVVSLCWSAIFPSLKNEDLHHVYLVLTVPFCDLDES